MNNLILNNMINEKFIINEEDRIIDKNINCKDTLSVICFIIITITIYTIFYIHIIDNTFHFNNTFVNI